MASLPNLGLGLWAPTSLKYSPAQGPWKWISPLVHLLGVICSPSSNSKILKHPFLLKTFSEDKILVEEHSFSSATIHWVLILCQSLFRVLNFLAGLIFAATLWNEYCLPTFPVRNLRPRVPQWPCGDTRLGAQMADLQNLCCYQCAVLHHKLASYMLSFTGILWLMMFSCDFCFREFFYQMMIIIVVNTYCALLLHLALHTSKDELI